MMNQYIYYMSDSSTHPGAALTRGPGVVWGWPEARVPGMIFVLKAMGLYSSVMFYPFFYGITMDYYGLTGINSD